jgi:hypothetical protein
VNCMSTGIFQLFSLAVGFLEDKVNVPRKSMKPNLYIRNHYGDLSVSFSLSPVFSVSKLVLLWEEYYVFYIFQVFANILRKKGSVNTLRETAVSALFQTCRNVRNPSRIIHLTTGSKIHFSL